MMNPAVRAALELHREETEASARQRLARLVTEVIARLSIIDIEVRQALNRLEARIAMLEAMQGARSQDGVGDGAATDAGRRIEFRRL